MGIQESEVNRVLSFAEWDGRNGTPTEMLNRFFCKITYFLKYGLMFNPHKSNITIMLLEFTLFY